MQDLSLYVMGQDFKPHVGAPALAVETRSGCTFGRDPYDLWACSMERSWATQAGIFDGNRAHRALVLLITLQQKPSEMSILWLSVNSMESCQLTMG